MFALWALVGCGDAVGPVADAGPGAETLDASKRDAETRDAEAPDAVADAGLVADAAPREDSGVGTLRVSRYMAFGSSSTQGAGASAPQTAYVPLLLARLQQRAPGVMLTNFGVGGGTVDGFLTHRADIRTLRPELATILPLTDYARTDPAAFEAGYTALLDALGEAGVTVFFGTLGVDPALVCGRAAPPNCYAPADQARLDAKTAIIDRLRATRPFVVPVRVFDQNVAHPDWSAPDGHPNDTGHAYLRDTFWAEIEPRLAP